jgi:SAM-dependent methyltransferase
MAFHRAPEAMRRFYDGFHPWYGFVEGNVGRGIAAALAILDPEAKRYAGDSVLEHCCGSGSFGLEMAPRCASYAGRDQSEGMLGRAKTRWERRFGRAEPAPFSRESVLVFDEGIGSVDWMAISFALHLFPPEEELRILGKFLAAARKGVIVVDHGRDFSPLLSLIEAIEGSWYEFYRRIDFAAFAKEAGADFRDLEVPGARVMEFLKPARREA